MSLNGEPWLPGRPLAAACRVVERGAFVGSAKTVHGAHELPSVDCTCGVYAAKGSYAPAPVRLRGAGNPRRSLSVGNSGGAQTWVACPVRLSEESVPAV